MEPIIGAGSPGAGQPAAVIESNEKRFGADVVEASMERLIIVDFWAPWCGPCKQLGPVLEKVVAESKGAVRLVKINVDENQALAGQLRVQSIPMIYAFSKGRPIDGFAGALPESQVRQFVDRLVKSTGATRADPIQEALEEAAERLEAGEHDVAAEIYGQIVEHEPDNVAALAGFARSLVALGRTDEARQALDKVPAAKRGDAAVVAARSALELAEKSAKVGDLTSLERKLAADANDHQTRFDLALALYGAGQAETAINHLVEIVRRDRQWNDQAARKQLVQFFDALGATDPVTAAGRRKLSSVLFS
ncbi:MAG: thioredoxin [Alphaproteobacteria bacterium]|nr:thioredoxin [Alphaproteobacteria bacterium]